MKPRWQVFFTKKLIPDLPDFMDMIDRLRLRERVEELGGGFSIFLHAPGPDGRAIEIEGLRPELHDLEALPDQLIESTRTHFSGRETLWKPENELISEIVGIEDAFPYAYSYPERLWMLSESNWDVFSNVGNCDAWWKLGNLKTDTVASILARFQEDECLGWRTINSIPARELAKRYGDPAGQKIYTDKDDLLSAYVTRYCREISDSEYRTKRAEPI